MDTTTFLLADSLHPVGSHQCMWTMADGPFPRVCDAMRGSGWVHEKEVETIFTCRYPAVIENVFGNAAKCEAIPLLPDQMVKQTPWLLRISLRGCKHQLLHNNKGTLHVVALNGLTGVCVCVGVQNIKGSTAGSICRMCTFIVVCLVFIRGVTH